MFLGIYTISVSFTLKRMRSYQPPSKGLHKNILYRDISSKSIRVVLPTQVRGQLLNFYLDKFDDDDDDEINVLHFYGSLLQIDGKGRGLYNPNYSEVSLVLKYGRTFV